MKVIGISGGTGAGKSTVCAELEKRGATVIDADKISRQVSARGGSAFAEIVECFGKEILTGAGEIDRRILGGIVFSDAEKLAFLNKITHKHIFAEMQRAIEECKTEVVVLDVPLLFQSDFPFVCDLTVAVLAQPDVRLERIMARDDITRDAAMQRMKNQMTDEEYAECADLCVWNNGKPGEVMRIAEEIINKVNLTAIEE